MGICPTASTNYVNADEQRRFVSRRTTKLGHDRSFSSVLAFVAANRVFRTTPGDPVPHGEYLRPRLLSMTGHRRRVIAISFTGDAVYTRRFAYFTPERTVIRIFHARTIALKYNFRWNGFTFQILWNVHYEFASVSLETLLSSQFNLRTVPIFFPYSMELSTVSYNVKDQVIK